MRLLLALHLLPLQARCQEGGDEFRRGPARAGGWVAPTQGEVWPKPRQQTTSLQFFTLNSTAFRFQVMTEEFHGPCEILGPAIDRYSKLLFPATTSDRDNGRFESLRELYNGELEVMAILITDSNGCEKYPHMDMDESYEIKIGSLSWGQIIAPSAWGVLRGMETFSQLVHTREHQYTVNGTEIADSPRFPHRGVMIDSSRHFITMDVIKETLDLMEMNKMNVFHWHLSDDNSFPYVSQRFPSLSQKGAWHASQAVYRPEDVAEVVEHARRRGVRVISEFDTPGHTQAWGLARPELLTQCYDENGDKADYLGPMDPTKEELFTFLDEFFGEITRVFPEELVHLGGDEVDYKCWESNPAVSKFMQKMGFGFDYSRLEEFFIKNLIKIVSSYPTNNGHIVWQEVLDNNIEVTNDTIIHVWKDWSSVEWERELARVTGAGLRAILSSPWYLNYINYGSDWTKFYLVEPLKFTGGNKHLVLGGEACLWGEFVSSANLAPRLWPRASAVAERLWSQPEVADPWEAGRRLAEHQCRMLGRGYRVEPAVGPGFCPDPHLL